MRKYSPFIVKSILLPWCKKKISPCNQPSFRYIYLNMPLIYLTFRKPKKENKAISRLYRQHEAQVLHIHVVSNWVSKTSLSEQYASLPNISPVYHHLTLWEREANRVLESKVLKILLETKISQVSSKMIIRIPKNDEKRTTENIPSTLQQEVKVSRIKQIFK